jgi:hypothetical protein
MTRPDVTDRDQCPRDVGCCDPGDRFGSAGSEPPESFRPAHYAFDERESFHPRPTTTRR